MIKLGKRFSVLFLILILLIGYLKKDYFNNKLKYLLLSYSNYIGMVLNEVYLSGRKHEKKENIIAMLNINVGDSIFSLDIEMLRKRINSLSWVQDSKVYLKPLGQLDIVLFEYIPFGVFKDKGDYYLINNEGIKFKTIEHLEFPNLVRLYGEGLIIAIKELPPIIKKLEQLNLQITKIERVHSRRWNVFTKQGFYIKLPNVSPENSIDNLYPLNNIDYNNLYSIDLRIDNRISLKYNK